MNKGMAKQGNANENRRFVKFFKKTIFGI